MYERVAKLDVFLWGRHVGALAPESGSYHVFQYDPAFVRSGLEISPLALPLRTELYRTSLMNLPKGVFWGLPGVFADSLPDSFGNALIDEWMREQGIPTTAVSALDRLAYVGDRGMGALTFEPRRGPDVRRPSALDMRELVTEARQALNERIAAKRGTEALREIIRVGTSAGGAQAKAVVGWNPTTDRFVAGSADLPPGYEHWLVKFSPPGLEDAGQSEFEHYRKARAAGISMSECRVYELDGCRHFMTRRFDRENGRRLHVQTFCALRNLPQGAPRELLRYEYLFRTAVDLGLGYETLEQLFRRMAFNVLVSETDDHTKNFAFLMRPDGRWELAPAYDLTGCHFSAPDADFNSWTNPHALSVNGKTCGITDDDLLRVADSYGLGTARGILEEVKSACR